jgi:hypothetical protein
VDYSVTSGGASELDAELSFCRLPKIVPYEHNRVSLRSLLYSAAYVEFAGLAGLWRLDDVQLLNSAYSIDETRRNLAMYRSEAVQLPQSFIRIGHHRRHAARSQIGGEHISRPEKTGRFS